MFPQGRLVPRQPWAIKRTTPTALRGYNIRYGGFTHGNADIIFTALRFFNFISCQKEERRKGCLQIDEPHRLLLLIAISKGRVGAKEVHERDEPHRGSAFDSPGLPNDSAGYPGLGYGLWRTTP